MDAKITPEQAKSTLGWIKIQCDSQLKKEIDRIINYIESLAADAEIGRAARKTDEELKSRSQLVKDILSDFKNTMMQAKDMDASPAVIRLIEHVHTRSLESIINRLIEAETELRAGKGGE